MSAAGRGQSPQHRVTFGSMTCLDCGEPVERGVLHAPLGVEVTYCRPTAADASDQSDDVCGLCDVQRPQPGHTACRRCA